MQETLLRKVKKEEIREFALSITDYFYDYPVYKVMFPNDSERFAGTFYFLWARMYTRQNHLYCSKDKSFVISYKRNGFKDVSLLRIILNPKFLFGALKSISLKSLISAYTISLDFDKMTESARNKYYDPEKDTYIQIAAVMKQERASGLFFRALDEIDDGSPVFMETHTEINAKLYELMGAHLCEAIEWNGITHYAMKKE